MKIIALVENTTKNKELKSKHGFKWLVNDKY